MILNDAVLSNDEKAIFALRSLYTSYGYRKYRMSKFEEYDFYVRNKGFLISDNIITFTDSDGKLMALKPDVTLSIIKNSSDGNGVQRVFYNENVYRASGDMKDIKEIMQTGLECVGDIDDYCICEVVYLATKSLECISADYALDISHMGIISEAMAFAQIPEENRTGLLRAFGEKNLQAVESICADDNVTEKGTELLKSLVTLYGKAYDVLPKLKSMSVSKAFDRAVNQLQMIADILKDNGCSGNVSIDFSVVNNMKYYSGVVFKGFINGIHGGVLSGGQYDNLMQKMGKKSGAIGFAVYLDMLAWLDDEKGGFDTDTVLLYDLDESAKDISESVKKLAENGERVTAVQTVPEKTRYKKLLKLEEGRVTIIEENA